mmetsp:Transcript_99296/g.256766  ORF Transcript_99296/g.256766 Transcript_99296/m.256766 type:complete len:206 (+) Transcript_99296:108-725(+)
MLPCIVCCLGNPNAQEIPATRGCLRASCTAQQLHGAHGRNMHHPRGRCPLLRAQVRAPRLVAGHAYHQGQAGLPRQWAPPQQDVASALGRLRWQGRWRDLHHGPRGPVRAQWEVPHLQGPAGLQASGCAPARVRHQALRWQTGGRGMQVDDLERDLHEGQVRGLHGLQDMALLEQQGRRGCKGRDCSCGVSFGSAGKGVGGSSAM